MKALLEAVKLVVIMAILSFGLFSVAVAILAAMGNKGALEQF